VIVDAHDPRLIDDLPTRKSRDRLREIAHGDFLTYHLPALDAEQQRSLKDISIPALHSRSAQLSGLNFLHLQTLLRDDERVDRNLSKFLVGLHLESVRQHRLQHQPALRSFQLAIRR
jgi:hypothetical protein